MNTASSTDDAAHRNDGVSLTPGVLTSLLESRFASKPEPQTFTYLGSRFLVSINPYEALDSQTDAAAAVYAEDYRNTRPGTIQRLPGIDDAAQFHDLRLAMKSLGLFEKYQECIFQILAAVLELGNLQLEDQKDTTVAEAAYVKNVELLDHIALLLGVDPANLQQAITYHTRMIGRELCTVYLDAQGSKARCDALARHLYSLLFAWLVEKINSTLECDRGAYSSHIGLVDLPGFQSQKRNHYEQFVYNYANERIQHFMNHHVFDVGSEEYAAEGVEHVLNERSYSDNTGCLDLFMKSGSGLLFTMDKLTKPSRKDKDRDCKSGPQGDARLLELFNAAYPETAKGKSSIETPWYIRSERHGEFGIRHFSREISYSIDQFADNNTDYLGVDFYTLFRGLTTADAPATVNPFVARMFGDHEIVVEGHPRLESAIINAQQIRMPQRAPFTSRPRPQKKRKITCEVSQYQRALTQLISSLDETLPWFVYCINPNDHQEARAWDKEHVQRQLVSCGIANVARSKNVEFTASLLHGDLVSRYSVAFQKYVRTKEKSGAVDKCEALRRAMGWDDSDMAIGKRKVFLSFDAWRQLEDPLRERERLLVCGIEGEAANSVAAEDLQSVYEGDDQELFPDHGEEADADIASLLEYSAALQEHQLNGADTQSNADGVMSVEDEKTVNEVQSEDGSGRKDGLLICPKQHVHTIEEMRGHNTADDALIAIRGEVFDIQGFNHMGVNSKYLVDSNYPGSDLSDKFPFQLSFVCPFPGMDPRLSLSPKPEPYTETWLHDHRFWRHPEMVDGGYNYYQYRLMRIMRENYYRGKIATEPQRVEMEGKGVGQPNGMRRYWSIINNEIFDLTEYIQRRGAPFVVAPDGMGNDTATRMFLDDGVHNLFQMHPGQDITSKWNRYFAKRPVSRRLHYQCLRGAFYVGVVDKRKSFQCYFANYVLLASSVALTSIIFFKFLAALQLGSRREPEEHDRFIICNVPCYTEGDEGLRSTLESLATLHYDDKRKLLFVICDGMIVGSGNDRPTPRIVLDILDTWQVLLSQRRRWINSTVHNLLELVFLPRLCGFCCFSMRFIVFIDLVSTIVMPATVVYLGYLIYQLAVSTSDTPLVSVYLLAAVYGLQALLFVFKRQWQHIGWMIVYLLALPVFSFFIPIYAFWHFDDFSWGNTRMVVGDGKKTKYVAEVEEFDPATIPLRKWEEYEKEILYGGPDKLRMDDARSELSSHASMYFGPPRPGSAGGSVYGANSYGYYQGGDANMHITHNPHVSLAMSAAGDIPCDASATGLTMMDPRFVGDAPGMLAMPPLLNAVHGIGGAGYMADGSGLVGEGASPIQYPSGMPNEVLMQSVRRILSTVDLMLVTKKQVRQQVAQDCNLDQDELSTRKSFINLCIDEVLNERL
ncbi:hypothetical protein GGI12_003602 [Dipsacomyces acuminosporus]|nr:hypothetical protein GGI12_003602 [Dipsacomyces acuminosporus]